LAADVIDALASVVAEIAFYSTADNRPADFHSPGPAQLRASAPPLGAGSVALLNKSLPCRAGESFACGVINGYALKPEPLGADWHCTSVARLSRDQRSRYTSRVAASAAGICDRRRRPATTTP
jgi:hypothetical protein